MREKDFHLSNSYIITFIYIIRKVTLKSTSVASLMFSSFKWHNWLRVAKNIHISTQYCNVHWQTSKVFRSSWNMSGIAIDEFL